MIHILTEKDIGFSKRGKCCNCGRIHDKEIVIMGEQDKSFKLCNRCFDELEKSMIKN